MDRVVYGGLLVVAAVILCFTLTIMAHTGRLKILYPRNAINLVTFSEKLEFASRYWILGLFVLYFTTHVVIFKRFISKAINPLSGHEYLVEADVKINTNSYEMFVYNVFAQTTLMTCLDNHKILVIIPLMNVLFFVGRILFWLGYPKYRAFGMTLSMIPASMGMFYALNEFVHFLHPHLYSLTNVEEVAN